MTRCLQRSLNLTSPTSMTLPRRMLNGRDATIYCHLLSQQGYVSMIMNNSRHHAPFCLVRLGVRSAQNGVSTGILLAFKFESFYKSCDADALPLIKAQPKTTSSGKRYFPQLLDLEKFS